ncbi:MAG: iron-containing alcohol dehydrogenase [Lachnospiraceae bacterium]|nr:iron-containing alcohol dehydrogenase [Lachnospiraceae bacterium]
MRDSVNKAYDLLNEWKQGSYIFGLGVMNQLGELVKGFGNRALVVGTGARLKPVADQAAGYLKAVGVEVVLDEAIPGARPNAPREDVYRLESYILHYNPDCIVAIGGGSTIDACKAASMLAAYGRKFSPEINRYFGTGIVSKVREKTGFGMIPVIAVQTSASSGAHLTKYSNITDPVAGQKLLIVDPAIVPAASLFDYELTVSMPVSVTIDGALDAIAHTFEVFCGAKAGTYELTKQLAETAIDLVLTYAGKVIENPSDREAREALGLATDLGGYAIMVGGTSGAHLTSFSLVDLIAHGTACGIMNPYYAVFYSPAIQTQLEVVGKVLAQHGFVPEDISALTGRARAEAVAAGLVAFGKSIGAPTKLSDLKEFSEEYVRKILTAAKDPQLSMKLKNMPVPMAAEDVDLYMEPVIRAAIDGDFSKIRNKE